jgi:error-prone DNA polymerase
VEVVYERGEGARRDGENRDGVLSAGRSLAGEPKCESARLGVRLGLGYIKGALAQEVRELVAERERGGPFRDLGDLAARSPTRRGTFEQLAWTGACDSLLAEGDGHPEARRRLALWQLGIAAPADSVGEEVQLALPIELPHPPHLRPLDRWQRVLADYATSGVVVDDHVMAILRPRLVDASGANPVVPVTSAQLSGLPHGRAVTVAGMVIARQRPGTAKGTMFLLFEDEWGTVNLIVPGAVYERHRPLARAEPLLLARGRLERSPSGVLNVLVRELAPLELFLAPAEEDALRVGGSGSVSRLPGTDPAHALEEQDGAEMGASMRAVAPPVQSFASGRRR